MSLIRTNYLRVAGVDYNLAREFRADVPTAYAPATLTRSRSSGIEPPDPDRFTVDLTVPPGGTAPRLGDVVELSASPTYVPGTDDLTFIGQIESLRRRFHTFLRPDGTTFDATVYAIAATDWFGVLARRTVGDVPWPREQIPDRWNRLSALVPDVPMVTRADYSGDDVVAPRDVDNTSALQLLRDTVALHDDDLFINVSGEIDARSRSVVLTAPDLWNTTLPDPYLPGGAPTTLHAPARLFADPDDVQDYDLVVNVARVTGKQPGDEPDSYADTTGTFVNATSRDAHGESTWSVSGDGLAGGPGNAVSDIGATRAAARARRLVNVAGDPVWRLDGGLDLLPHLVTEDTDMGWLASLLGSGFPLAILVLDGAPPGRDVWRIVGLRATWGGPPHDALTLDVEPYEMSAPLGLTFIGATVGPPFTFEASVPMTFARARTVGAVFT